MIQKVDGGEGMIGGAGTNVKGIGETPVNCLKATSTSSKRDHNGLALSFHKTIDHGYIEPKFIT